MPPARIDKKELPLIIHNIESRGGDASELRAILESTPRRVTTGDISDDDLVELIREDSTVEEGEGLVCSICGGSNPRLTSGVCDPCFRQWAISCKEGYLSSRRKHGDPSDS